MNAPMIDWAESRLYKLRLTDVEVLQAAGVFDNGPRVELIEGVLIAVSPQLRPHSFLRNELTFRFRLALSRIRSTLSAQAEPTVQISPTSAPEPDIALTDAPNGPDYVPMDSVALIVEISNSTLRFDLGDKRDIYAAAGVPENWVIDVNKAQVHRFTRPTDGGRLPARAADSARRRSSIADDPRSHGKRRGHPLNRGIRSPRGPRETTPAAARARPTAPV